jgi:hypothetical protein
MELILLASLSSFLYCMSKMSKLVYMLDHGYLSA